MKQTGMRKAYAGTQAVVRALSLLKAFHDEKPSWTLMDLANDQKLNKTTTFRLLTALESEGLVRRESETETYTLGLQAIVIGARAMRSNSLRTVCRPELKKLADLSRETATLEVLNGRHVLILDEATGTYLMGRVQSIGTRWPAFATSTGKAIMAYLQQAEADAILRYSLPKYTPKTVTDPSALRKEFEVIKRVGYAVADEALELGFLAVGAPLLQHDGDVVGAISVGGPTVRLIPERAQDLGQMVCRAAQRISKHLGYRKESS